MGKAKKPPGKKGGRLKLQRLGRGCGGSENQKKTKKTVVSPAASSIGRGMNASLKWKLEAKTRKTKGTCYLAELWKEGKREKKKMKIRT